MVVVSEHAKSAAKGTTVGTHLSRPLHKTQNVSACPQWLLCSLSLSMALVANATWAGVANTALPTGANITQGSAQISQNNNSLNINQNSQNLSTNWNTFNIGKDATVNFNQPNQSSIAVNRVLDNNASQIMGKLNANGQVFLLNPNGVIFSKTAQVNVGGIVASTLNLSDSDIAQGKLTLKNSLENQGNVGSVENYGSIIAGGGVVALIAPTVKNHGTIQANNGVVHLTAADQVTLQLQDGSLVEYQIDLGTLQGLVENGGAIQADNGAVYLTAQAKNSLSKTVVNHTGIIEANRLEKNAKGEIILLGDMQTGTTTVSGTLKAEGKNGQDGGFIETSAANVQIADSTQVSTRSDGGKTGEWLIDPFNVTISNQAQAGNNNAGNTFTPSQNDSIINVGTLNSALASNNITVTTAGAGTQAGNINVNADVTWNANTALTLRADNDININANITATNNNGKLNLQYGQTTSNINANYYLNNGAKVNLKAGQNFSTQKGANAPINYTVITDLGAAGSTTGTDLQGISGGLAGNYVLGADIDATATSGWNNGQGFSPIGIYGHEFKGKFDGLNHTVSNLYINRPSQNRIGLFGATSAANIQNIGVVGGSITGREVVGGLVGGNDNNATIRSSYSTAQVIAKSFAGGLTGVNQSGSRIENSYATGAVQAQGSNAGGLSGNNYGNSVIKNSYATGAVSGIDAVGGLLGNNDSSTVENSYATGQVTKTSGNAMTFGGLVGWYGGTIKDSYWNSATTGQTQAVGDNSGNLTSVVGLTTAQMFDKNSLSGFEFDIIWGNGDNQTTPYLKNHIGLNNVINKNDTVAGASYAVIQTLNQLQGMSGNLSGKYVLGADIDATATSGWNNGQGFNPIGNLSNGFNGKFDGLNHTISNLTINRAVQDGVGLFGVTNNATIQNIGLIQANIKGYNRVGALIGWAESTNTSNASSTGQVNGFQAVGGLVGFNQNQSNILSSYSNAQVTATDGFAGGLSGANQFDSRIENSYATGAVQTQGSYAGGLSGNNAVNSVIKNSYATGAVSGIERVGGLLGNNNSSTVENSYATGQVTRTSGNAMTFGGLVGRLGGTIKNSYWNSATTGQAQAVGDNSGNLTSVVDLTTAQMFNKNSLSGFDFDIIWGNGDNQTTPYLKNHIGLNNVINKNDTVAGASYAVIQTLNQLQGMSGNLSGKYVLGADIDATATSGWNNGQGFNPIGDSNNHFTGIFDGLGFAINDLYINRPDTGNVGLFARIRNATVQNIGLNRATVTGKNDVGSLIGEMNNSTLRRSYSDNANVTGIQAVGGLVGSSYNGSLIEQNYSTGMVEGRAQTGGLVGTNSQQSTIKESYSIAKVDGSGDSYTGGLAGQNNIDSNISQSYATGQITGVGGALVGVNEGNAQITQSYWSTEISGATRGIDITQLGGSIDSDSKDLTAEQMKNGASFVGFDIDGQGGTGKVWRIYEGNTAPLLRSFLTQATLGTVANQSTTYNGQTQGLDLSGVPLAGLDSSKIFAGQSSSKNVGTYNIGLYSNQQGYDLIGGNASLTINKADLAITGLSAFNKVYDTNTVATLTGTPTIAQFGSDSVTLGGDVVAAFANKNVGTNKAVTVTGFTLSGADAGNYNLVQPTGLKANISKADLALAGLSADNKVYNGNTLADLFGTASVSPLGSDAVVLSGTGIANFADKNVGTHKTVTVSGYTLSGADAANYNLVQPTGGLKANITPATLTYTADVATSIYGDATTGLTGTVAGFVNGENLANATTGTASFSTTATATSHVGQYAIAGSGLTANNGNYVFVQNAANTTALTINPATLTITANAGQNKVYGDIDPTLGYGVSGWKLSDDHSLLTGALGRDSGENAGLYTMNTGTVAAGGNYTIAYDAASPQFEIQKAQLTIIADAGQHKVYGDTDPTLGYAVSGWKFSDDNSLLTGALGRASGENAGLYAMNKGTVAAGGNYTIAYDVASPQFEITPATLTIIADAGQNKVYGDADPTLSYAVSGWKFSDNNSLLTGALERAAGKNVGNYAINQGSLLATSNYDISYTGADFAITPRTLTATINAQNKVYDGNSSAAVIYGDNRVSGDFLNITGNPATFSDKNAGSNKIVIVNGLTLSGADAGNYVLAATTATDTADISKAQAIVTANSLNTVYNGQDQTVNGFSVTGLVNGEDQSVLTHVRATVTAKEVGTYANKATGMDGNYELRFVDGVLEIQASPIEPKPPVPQPEPEQPKPPVPQPEPEQPKPPVPQPEPEQPKPPVPQPEPEQPPVTPSYYPTWANPYQRAIRTQPLQQPKTFDIVEIEIEGNGINMDNIQTLGNN